MLELSLKAAGDIVDDQPFWDEMKALVLAGSLASARHLVLEGVTAAQSAGVIVDFDGIHAEALAVTRRWTDSWWEQLDKTTRAGLREALTTWQEAGLGKRGLPDLIDALQPLFSPVRAKRIAVTEATRLFAEGNKLAVRDDETVGGLEWQTAQDALVCPICGPLNSKIYPKDSPPSCPQHVNCRCALIPVSWRALQENASQWQGGPLPETEMQAITQALAAAPLPGTSVRITVENQHMLDAQFAGSSNWESLSTAINRWTYDGDRAKDIRLTADRLLAGGEMTGAWAKDRQNAAVLLDAVKHAPIVGEPLYRGIDLTKAIRGDDASQLRTQLGKVDNAVSISLNSASPDKAMAQKFMGKKGILLTIVDSKGLSVAPISQHGSENEVIISGRFRVVAVTSVGNRMYVDITQVDDLPSIKSTIRLNIIVIIIHFPSFAEIRDLIRGQSQ